MKEEVSLGQELGDFHTCKDIFGTANARQTEAYSLQVNTMGMADESGDKPHSRKPVQANYCSKAGYARRQVDS